MITANQLNTAYDRLAKAMLTYHESAQAEVKAKSELESLRLTSIAAGAINGKNVEEREAVARQLMPCHYNNVVYAERAAADARLALDLARLDVERVRALLRIDELVSNGQPV